MNEIKSAIELVSALPPLVLTTLAVWIVSQTIKQLPFDNRLMPFVASGVGVVFGVLIGIGWHGDVVQGIVFGILAGVLSVGSHTTIELLLSYFKK